MKTGRLVSRGLTYYWRTNIAVVAGVATAVAVLAGALLVGDSVRGSLRDLVLQRLGRTNHVVTSAGFFNGRLADAVRTDPAFAARFTGIAPLTALRGIVTAQESGRRAGQVHVYGVDDRFWAFHGVNDVTGPGDREAFVSQTLAREISADAGTAILVRVQRPSDVPMESLHGRKEDLGRTVRLTVQRVLPASSLGDFALDARQGGVRAVFVPLSRLQMELEQADQVNTLLVSSNAAPDGGASDALTQLVRTHATLDDIGITLREATDRPFLVVGSQAGLLDDSQSSAVARAFSDAGLTSEGVFTYLANTMRVGDREVPYSLVTATDLGQIAPSVTFDTAPGVARIVLNQWAADALQASPRDMVSMEYYVWEEPGRLVTRSSEFQVAAIVPTGTGDRDLAPVFPGISSSPTLADWDPPFPIDLRRIRPVDEDYWEQYRTTPKAFIALEDGQRLWRSRYGALTSVRSVVPDERMTAAAAEVSGRLRSLIDPFTSGFIVRDVRSEGLAASAGATDFGEYFVYFSFFLVVSALLLAALFFKLGIEQRGREVGLLRAVGFDEPTVRRLFVREGLVLAGIGGALGVAGAIGYAALVMLGLRSWWVDAVGTTALTLHVSPLSLIGGALGGLAAAMACIWWTLRSLSRVSERSLLAGQIEQPQPANGGTAGRLAWIAGFLALAGSLLVAAALGGAVGGAGAFFGAGAAFLTASLCFFAVLLRRRPTTVVAGHGWRPISSLGIRNASGRPGRSVLSMAVIAAATFILIAVDAFRRDGSIDASDRSSGTGGYTLLVESLLPIVHDPNTPEGREALNLLDVEDVTFEPFRLLPGDDASCLNLYAPANPRILAPGDSFLDVGRFTFQGSLASQAADLENPWRLLRQELPDGAVPVIADANSMTYVLHRRLGDDIVLTRGDREIRLRLVGALRDSVFQGELLMSQENFLRLFPDQEGYRVMLVDAPVERTAALAADIENALSDLGADAVGTADRLAEFHRVENTYLSTFQTLGGLGLILGTIGMAAVLMRNVLERRRELALLGAVGYRKAHFLLMVAAENTLLLAGGLIAGSVCAAIAIAPAAVERGARVPLTSGGALLVFSVFVTGLLSSLLAARAATRAPLLESLRSD